MNSNSGKRGVRLKLAFVKDRSDVHKIPWHSLESSEVFSRLQTNHIEGLESKRASELLLQMGPNEIIDARARSPISIFIDQFRHLMIWILIVAAVTSGVLGEVIDTIVILLIVLLNSLIGFFQDYRSERAVLALKKLSADKAKVLRSNALCILDVTDLVPGDIVLIEAGDRVPADMRLIEVQSLKVDESMLTGESLTVQKECESILAEDVALADQANMIHKGTLVVYGRARGVVVATGMQTQFGQIAKLLMNQSQQETPLQKRLSVIGKNISILVIFICGVIFLMGLYQGQNPLDVFMTALSLAVAAIPEALPAVVTLALAFGSGRLALRRALVRKLAVVETLGSVTYICSDKTGTLTQNKMTVESVLSTSNVFNEQALLYKAMALNSDVVLNSLNDYVGEPTELGIARFLNSQAREKIRLLDKRLAELPFDSSRKCMTTFHKSSDGVESFTKGAPEEILSRCFYELRDEKIVPVDRDKHLAEMTALAQSGGRVLSFAYRKWEALPHVLDLELIESQLIYLGHVSLIDPPRPEAEMAIRECHAAGMKTVMITGDHKLTAMAIARRLNIAQAEDEIITGAELDKLSEGEFLACVEKIRVYARTSPEQKIKIVSALQKMGECVAMTGDGVNDAPALKKADIGVAMGQNGTDVAREASQLVLLDDNFATIVMAIREGRRIFDNIKKFIRFALAGNSGEIWVIFLAPFLGLPLPLLPVQILWINLVTDGLPGLALTLEKEENKIMNRRPRPVSESVFAGGLWQHVLWVGLLIGGITLFTQYWAIAKGSANWQTMAFTVLSLAQMAHVVAIRSDIDSVFKIGFFSNRWLIVTVILTLLLQIVIIYIPFFSQIFKLTPLTFNELLFCLLISASVFVAVEIEKVIRRIYIPAE